MCFIGIIDGYSDEKIIFEREIQEKNFIIDRLEQELLCTSTRLQELEAEHQQVSAGRTRVAVQAEGCNESRGWPSGAPYVLKICVI